MGGIYIPLGASLESSSAFQYFLTCASEILFACFSAASNEISSSSSLSERRIRRFDFWRDGDGIIRTGESDTVACFVDAPFPFDFDCGDSGSGVVCFAISEVTIS